MTTMRCPQCGQPVRFEGKSGLCPKCMTVVNAPGTGGKAGSAGGPAGPSKGRVKSRSSVAADLDGLARDAEVFAPPSATGQTSHGGGLSSLDPRLLYGGGAAILLVVLFGLFEVLYTPTTSVVVSTPQPFAYPAHASVAAPPEEKAAVLPPPPVVPPPTAVVAGAPVLAVPRWYGLRPTVPLLPADTINDALVERALTRAVAYLKPMVAAADLPHTADGSQWLAGGDGLVTYALLHTGEAIEDPDLSTSSPLMSAALDRLKAAPPDKTYATYLHSVRAQALALADREADHDQLASDQRWLLKAERDGAYSYTSAAEPGWVQWDHSNSQYGVLGVWAASEAGVPAPAAYWQDVERHWVQTQNTDGGWPYSTSRESTAPMTAAGVTTLCVAAEQEVLIIDGRDAAAEHRSPKAATNHPTPARPSPAGQPAPPPPVTTAELTGAIDRGLAYLGGDDVVLNPGRDEGYTLYGLERAALATGLRYFGSHDWYRTLGAKQLASQQKDGSWKGDFGPPIETAFRLLFLARGRQPLLMDKLRFDGDWNDRPRDVAKLASFVSTELEHPFAWGVAELHRDWSDWLDAPLLFITTDAPPTFSDDDVRKLRAYSDAGGLIFIHNEFAAKDVDAFAKDLAHRVFPEYPLTPVPPTGLLYGTVFKMTAGPTHRLPPLQAVDNGSRTLLVYSPTDITKDWVTWRAHGSKGNQNLDLGLNLFVAAAGKGDFRNRLDTPDVEPPVPALVTGTVPVQRLTYPGGLWDPEPAAWPRFGRWFFKQTSLTLDLRPTAFDAVNLRAGPVAVLTGNRPVDFGKMDLHALGSFVRRGGTLLVDAAGGDRRFDAAVRDQLLPAAFPGATLAEMPLDHPVLAGDGACMTPLPKPRLRKFASAQLGLTHPPGVQYLTFGSGTVVVSDLDVTTSLLHSGTYGILGYTPAYADGLCKNAILWTLSRFPAPRPATAPAATRPAVADRDGR